MKPERWKQVDELLEATLDCPVNKRASFLDRACSGDEELRREVESLLHEALDVSVQVADALAVAHSRGVINRDIKPSNIMVTSKGQVLKQSVEYFQRAINLDPQYALAYVGLSDSYKFLGAFGLGVLPPTEVHPKAREAALNALAIDSTLAEAHTSLGFVKLYYDWDWPGAEKEYKLAVEANPQVRAGSPMVFASPYVERPHQRALAEAIRALELEPASGKGLLRTVGRNGLACDRPTVGQGSLRPAFPGPAAPTEALNYKLDYLRLSIKTQSNPTRRSDVAKARA